MTQNKIQIVIMKVIHMNITQIPILVTVINMKTKTKIFYNKTISGLTNEQ